MPSTPSGSKSAISNGFETVASKTFRGRPRFFVLMIAFLAVSAVTVGVLGWQLTLRAAKYNIESLVIEIEDLISAQIMSSVVNQFHKIEQLTALQASLFRKNTWTSLKAPATVDQNNRTMTDMFALLDNMADVAKSVFYITYPDGLMFGYSWTSNNTFVMWDQVGLTNYVWQVDANGNKIGTPDNHGTSQDNNNTLYYGPTGASGANIDFSNANWHGFSDVNLISGRLWKTSLRVVVNLITNEKVITGNDMTMDFLSDKLQTIVEASPYPVVIDVIEISTGFVVASWPRVQAIAEDGSRILRYNEISSIILQDFSAYVDSFKTAASPLSTLADGISALHQKHGLFVDRYVNGSKYILQLNIVQYGTQKLLTVLYLNTDDFNAQVTDTSTKTGYMIGGIILAFVFGGYLFSITITRQLDLVSRQINLLKCLKFSEVLDKDSGVKGRSFVFELANLQEAFHEMVTVFADTLKASNSLRQGSGRLASTLGNNQNQGTVVSKSAPSLPGNMSAASSKFP
ncbi:hypothetical protein HDU79_005678 [Rhizoclosmatium sp. JEL0117]|nr:hypothetical protein HDU79_005678 [Rhizoclosmatium sp. JEL0117]